VNHPLEEDPVFLTQQLISYRGNKRKLLPLLGEGLSIAKTRLGRDQISILDGFAGSGICSRFFKAHASLLIANDLQPYAATLGRCYLHNRNAVNLPALRRVISDLRTAKLDKCDGFIQSLYAPREDDNIKEGERVFFTRRNALILDNVCRRVQQLDESTRALILGPLLAEASVHSNTAGHFKGFLKDRTSKRGAFGGATGSQYDVITAEIDVRAPVLSRFDRDCRIYCKDIDDLVADLEEMDVAYYDPPYEAQPYGYLYFMLDILVSYQEPKEVSEVAGVPKDWIRSQYSTEKDTLDLIVSLVERTRARFVMLSYSNEGQIAPDRLSHALARLGKMTILEQRHQRMNSARGSDKHGTRGHRETRPMVIERLYVVEKS
jgi:adenine-specific DNA-methyltransferase